MEENMQQIGNMVTNLRNMALDMNAEVSDQNEQMDRITLKVKLKITYFWKPAFFCKATCNENRVTNANKKAVQLLKNWA